MQVAAGRFRDLDPHWSEQAQARHDARARLQAAKFREFIFLDLASQAVTLFVRQRDAAKLKA